MESPESWDLLTASLAVSDLTNPEFVWAFLVVQGLVRGHRKDRLAFLELLRFEQERGPITGPTLAARVASALSTRGITQSRANVADPNARIANQRIETIGLWRGSGMDDS